MLTFKIGLNKECSAVPSAISLVSCPFRVILYRHEAEIPKETVGSVAVLLTKNGLGKMWLNMGKYPRNMRWRERAYTVYIFSITVPARYIKTLAIRITFRAHAKILAGKDR